MGDQRREGGVQRKLGGEGRHREPYGLLIRIARPSTPQTGVTRLYGAPRGQKRHHRKNGGTPRTLEAGAVPDAGERRGPKLVGTEGPVGEDPGEGWQDVGVVC